MRSLRPHSLIANALILVSCLGTGPASAAPQASAAQGSATPGGVLFSDPDGQQRFELPEEQGAALLGVRADPPPPETTRGLHYVVSNELKPFQFKAAVDRLGGVHIGVGAEQNYLLAGWSRPDLLILMDFDQVIVDLHDVYRVAFSHCDSPEAFRDFWQRRNRKKVQEQIRDAYPNRRRRLRALQAFRISRRAISVRLNKLAEAFAQVNEKYFLNDQEQYAHLAGLYRAGRVLAVRGDLTAWRTMRDLGRVLTAQGRVVRTLYMSNAEQYFPYERAFRLNIAKLPTDARSLVLRTRPTGFDYTYVLQRFDNFRRWLAHPGVRSVRLLAPRRKLSRNRPLYEITDEPPPLVKKHPRKRARPKLGKKRRPGGRG